MYERSGSAHFQCEHVLLLRVVHQHMCALVCTQRRSYTVSFLHSYTLTFREYPEKYTILWSNIIYRVLWQYCINAVAVVGCISIYVFCI